MISWRQGESWTDPEPVNLDLPSAPPMGTNPIAGSMRSGDLYDTAEDDDVYSIDEEDEDSEESEDFEESFDDEED